MLAVLKSSWHERRTQQTGKVLTMSESVSNPGKETMLWLYEANFAASHMDMRDVIARMADCGDVDEGVVGFVRAKFHADMYAHHTHGGTFDSYMNGLVLPAEDDGLSKYMRGIWDDAVMEEETLLHG